MKKIFTIIALFFSVKCFCQKMESPDSTWRAITFTDNYIVYLKTDYVVKVSYGGIKVWVMNEYRTKKVKGRIYKGVQEKILYQIDCDKKQLQTIRIVTYDANGKLIDSTPDYFYDFMKDVVPSTVGEEILKESCKLYNK